MGMRKGLISGGYFFILFFCGTDRNSNFRLSGTYFICVVLILTAFLEVLHRFGFPVE